ncbi:dienelactone hydrolase family protein [Phenylobacterium sp.]|jgi:carboxymethylenebutenolidase|uniref:dienelactone hydrolase family protein n=1 Tax=Phenylobacterium sp. TaxID=1871053 RepID=UPI002E37C27F|nr:dienelactone hydrolase family protein [Phenylobacterium sp.]HEX2559382.1 dienelactone hydrolase family protein [Phenylobacterium sp.]
MLSLTRPEGTRPEDLHLSRRALGLAAFGGYAIFALSADAEPIQTDEAGLVTETVQLPAADRPVPAYLARPDAPGRFPVVVVVSEVFGVHEYVRDVCRRLAKLGYVALAPDFFVRAGRDPSTMSDFGEIRKIVSTASDAQVMGDLRAGLAFLSRAPFAERRRMAITGFCWGGAVVWLACSRFREFRAGVAWYGRLARPKPGDFLGEPERQWPIELVSQLRAPVLGLYAGEDQGIPLTDVEAMRQALAANRKRGSEIIVYPEAQHGFHADYRAQYNAQAALDGWSRMLLHFARNGVAPRTV